MIFYSPPSTGGGGDGMPALTRVVKTTYGVSVAVGNLYECQSTLGTLALPAGSGLTEGDRIEFEHNGSGTLTIARAGSDLINGGTSHTLSVRYEVIGVRWTGTEWRIY